MKTDTVTAFSKCPPFARAHNARRRLHQWSVVPSMLVHATIHVHAVSVRQYPLHTRPRLIHSLLDDIHILQSTGFMSGHSDSVKCKRVLPLEKLSIALRKIFKVWWDVLDGFLRIYFFQR